MVEPRIRNPLTSKHEVTLCEIDETNSEYSRYKNNHRMYYIHVFCCPVNWLSESHPNTVHISVQQQQHQLTSIWDCAVSNGDSSPYVEWECITVLTGKRLQATSWSWNLKLGGSHWNMEQRSMGWRIFIFELHFSTNKFKGAKHNFL